MSAGLKDADGLGFMVMVVQVVMTAVSIPLMDTAGRKFLLLTACGGLAFEDAKWIQLATSK